MSVAARRNLGLVRASYSTMTSELLPQLLDCEERGWKALCTGNAEQVYEELMTDDARMLIGPANGAVMTKPQILKIFGQGPSWVRFEIENAAAMPLGNEAAALLYTGRSWKHSQSQPFVASMSTIYIKIAGQWRLKLYHQLEVKEPVNE